MPGAWGAVVDPPPAFCETSSVLSPLQARWRPRAALAEPWTRTRTRQNWSNPSCPLPATLDKPLPTLGLRISLLVKWG